MLNDRSIAFLRCPRTIVTPATLALSCLAGAQTFSDGTFDVSTWSTSVVATNGAGGSANYSQVATGGNPGSYGSVQINVSPVSTGNASQAFFLALKNGAYYDPATQGAIASISSTQDGEMLDGFGFGQGVGAALEQNGQIYASYFGQSDAFGWSTYGSSSLTAPSFGLVYSGGDGAFIDFADNPNFSSSGSTIQFGFWRNCGSSNSDQPGFSITTGIDNWSVSVTPAAVPEPPALLALGVLAFPACLRRRLRTA